MLKGYKKKISLVCTVCRCLRLVYRCDGTPFSPAEQAAEQQGYVCGDHPEDTVPGAPMTAGERLKYKIPAKPEETSK